jgi:hypothetical protein
MVNKNVELWQKFLETKREIRTQIPTGTKPLDQIVWHSIASVLDEKAGECWLFHGTNHAKSIIQNGFTTKFAQNERFSGYGALGKGIYLTDLFSKAAIYINCSECKNNHCTCPPPKKSQKVALLCRVTLGRVKVVPSNSFRSEYRRKEAPPPGFHSIWAPDKAFDLLESGFDANEFCVPESQVYPEFVIVFEDNNFDVKPNKSNPNLFLTKMEWDTSYKSKFESIQPSLIASFEHSLIDYDGLVSLENQEPRQILFLTNKLKPLLVTMITEVGQRGDKTEMFHMKEFESKWWKEFNRLQNNQDNHIDALDSKSIHSYVLQFESKIFTQYEHKSWSKAIQSTKEMLFKYRLKSSFMDFFLFVRSKSFRELKQYDNYVTSMNEALMSSDSPILKSLLFQVNLDKEFEIYFETSLMCLLNSIERHLGQDYFDSWVQCVIYWIYEHEDTLNTLKSLNFTLRKHSNVSFERILGVEDEFCPNEMGVRQSTKKQKIKWYKKLKSEISSETRTSVKMYWLNESGQKVTRYMKDNFVNIVFGLDGKPVLNNDLTQRTGKKHVVVLKNQKGTRLVYLKFYPDYPLRQQAVDELCFRLSGHGLISSLVKLTHDKEPSLVYPVLFSEPMGADDTRPTLHDNLFKVEEIEANFDMSLFSWKFLETFILRPREEKPDNVAVNVEPSSSKYFYASLDNDVTFGHRRYTCEQPNVYSIIYLSDLMWQPCSTSVVSAIIFMDIEKLFYEWINEFKEANQYLFGNEDNCLFNLYEVASIKRLIGSEYMGKSISCNLDACFTDADLIGVFNRLIKVKHVLQQRSKSIFKLDKKNKRQLILSEYNSHFDLLQQLDSFDYKHYTRVNNEKSIGDDYQTRFKKLPGFITNFIAQRSENEAVIISSKAVNEPITAYRLIKSKLGIEKIIRIKTLASVDDQLNVLAYYTSSLSASLNDFMKMEQKEKSIFFKNVNWNLLSPQIQRDIFNHLMRDDIDIAQLCFVDLTLLDDDTLAKISRQQRKSLEKISIKNCSKLTSNLFANRNEFRLKSLFLTDLNQFVKIKAQTLNITYLYLYELSRLERFEIEWDGSQLKEICIELCTSLVLLNLNLMQLKLLTLKKVNFEELTLKYNLRSIEQTDENYGEHEKK